MAEPVEHRLERLADELHRLSNGLGALERRVERLESRPSEVSPVELSELLPHAPTAAEAGSRMSRLVPLVGRTLLILGGAFLLRSLTDLESVPNALGLLLGYLYALWWIGTSWREAAVENRRGSAAFHGVTAATIALPLVLEAVARFELLSLGQAALAIAVTMAALLTVAWRRDLMSVAIAASIGGGAILLALLRFSAASAPVLLVTLAAGLVALGLRYARGWAVPAWGAALLADLSFAVVPAGLARGRFESDPGIAVALLLALFVGYVAVVSVCALRKGRQVGALEVVQSVLVSVIAFGGVRQIGEAYGAVAAFTAVVVGTAAYGIAFSSAIRHERRRNFFFFTTLALALIAVGSLELLRAPQAALLWSILGVACALLSGRYARVTLSLHSTAFLLAAMFASGLARAATAAFWMPRLGSWPSIDGVEMAVMAAMAACLAIPVARKSGSWGRLARLPRAALLLFTVWAVGGASIAALGPRLFGVGEQLDAGALAASRTGVLAIAALLLAGASRVTGYREAGWLVYPLLLVAGARVVSQDLLQGRPVTLFVSLALLGASLMVSARWLRSAAGDSPVEEGAEISRRPDVGS